MGETMTEEEVINFVICNPTSAGPPRVPSIITQCGDCGQDVWMTNHLHQHFETAGLEVRVKCRDCAYASLPDDINIVAAPGQREELASLGIDLDDVMKRAREKLTLARDLRKAIRGWN
jgi:hypothetical protein